MSLRKTCKTLFDILPATVKTGIRKRYYLKRLRQFQIDEEPDQRIVEQLVRPGDDALDLGANIGVYTRLLSNLVGPSGSVMSFEPVPSTFDLLAYNVSSLGLKNVKLQNLAVGEREGTVSMCLPGAGAGSGSMYRATVVTTGEDPQFEVRIGTVDGLIESMSPRFIKIDVEGHELETIRGAAETIRRCEPALQVEVNDNPDTDPYARELFQEIEGFGYRAFWYDSKTLKAREVGETWLNFFFLKSQHLERLAEGGVPVQS